MENPMGINGTTYALAASATSSYVTLNTQDVNSSRVIVTNITNNAVYVFTSNVSSETIAFPTTSGKGKVIPAGAVMTFGKSPQDLYIYCISQATEAGKHLYFSVGGGV